MLSHLERLGYRDALRAAGIRFDGNLCVATAISEEGGAQAAHRLLELADPPTAILCGHDLIAMGLMRGIAETGKAPGRDIAVIGGDNHPFGCYVQPALTTFSAARIARACAWPKCCLSGCQANLFRRSRKSGRPT